VLNHAVYGIITAAADTDYFNHRRIALIYKLKHEASPPVIKINYFILYRFFREKARKIDAFLLKKSFPFLFPYIIFLLVCILSFFLPRFNRFLRISAKF